MRGKIVRQKLLNGERVYGTHIINYGNPFSAGFTAELEMDFIFICTEHIPIDRTEVSNMCNFYALKGISPIVRIPYPSDRWASMAIEGGAEGIVAPYVETVEEVKELVGAVRYRPIKGAFLKDILDGKREPKEKSKKFLENFNENKYLILGVESVHAINNLENLISIDGVDGVFLGPHDITVSMEIPEEYGNPEFVDTIVDVIKRCRKMGKGVGIHMDALMDNGLKYIDAGMNFVLNLADIVKMRQTLANDFSTLRSRYGDVYERNATETTKTQSCLKQE